MSQAEQIEQDQERPKRAVLIRYAPLTGVEGRTIDARIVPYNTAARVSDDRGRTFYREEWAPGAFDEQLVAGHRLKVLLNFEHERGISNVVGKGISLRSESDGLHGTFDLLSTQDGDKALELVNAGILDGISLEAWAKKTVQGADGTRRRVRAHLDGAALTRSPAFADARVLAVREETEFVLDEDLLPVPFDPELAGRLERLGLQVPETLKAHPADGHPGLAGTPTDGTRRDNQPKTGGST